MGDRSPVYRLAMLPATQANSASSPQQDRNECRPRDSGQGTVAVLYGWEGNRRFGVAPVMRHGLCDISILRTEDEHPAYTTVKSMSTLYFFVKEG